MEPCLAGNATSQPNDLRRRADAVLQVDEIAILCHHHHARSGRLPIDDFIVGVSQADIPDRKRMPRMQGRPPQRAGLAVMRCSNSSIKPR